MQFKQSKFRRPTYRPTCLSHPPQPGFDTPDKLSLLTVGNGEFAYTADVTGLQTFLEFYSRDGETNSTPPGPDGFETNPELEGSTPLVTQSQWGWHTFPNPQNFTMEDAMQTYDTNGKQVPYASRHDTPVGDWLRQNSHRLNLGRIGFELRRSNGTSIEMSDLEQILQELDLWSGTLHSEFEIEGQPVSVHTRVHPERDLLSVQLDASSLNSDQIAVSIAFPYARGIHGGDPSDWTNPDLHSTQEIDSDSQSVTWHRILDDDDYFVRFASGNTLNIASLEKHHYKTSFFFCRDLFPFPSNFLMNNYQMIVPIRIKPTMLSLLIGKIFGQAAVRSIFRKVLIPELMNWSAGLCCRSTCWFFQKISPWSRLFHHEDFGRY